MNRTPALIMTFSASDPTGGAGLQADALTAAALGAHALNVLTGLTAQNTVGVDRFEPCEEAWLRAQVDCLLRDTKGLHALKAGVLGSEVAVWVLAEVCLRWPHIPLVLDPVMASGRGDAFGMQAVFECMKTQLFPQVSLLTPNWLEAQALSGQNTEKEIAAALLDLGCEAVLLKGEHRDAGERVFNRLHLQNGEVHEFACARLEGHFHGSGCTLATACAVGLGQGLELVEAVARGLDFTWQALEQGMQVGQGQLIPDRLHNVHSRQTSGGNS